MEATEGVNTDRKNKRIGTSNYRGRGKKKNGQSLCLLQIKCETSVAVGSASQPHKTLLTEILVFKITLLYHLISRCGKGNKVVT